METAEYRVTRDAYEISTERSRIDIDAVERFLRDSYWAANRSRDRIERSLETSLCFGLYRDSEMVGFARVVSDYTDFAWYCDVYIARDHRGRGLGKWLTEAVLAHPDLQGLRRWILATSSAHELYRQYGFTELQSPEKWMERYAPPSPLGNVEAGR